MPILPHWGPNKMAIILQQHLQKHFIDFLYFVSNLLKFHPLIPIDNYSAIAKPLPGSILITIHDAIWHHQATENYMICVTRFWKFMITSSNGNIFRVTGPLCGKFTGPGEFPSQRPVTRSFDVFFDLHLNKCLSKQSRGWRFEMPLRPLWRHCNVNSLSGIHNCIVSWSSLSQHVVEFYYGVRP